MSKMTDFFNKIRENLPALELRQEQPLSNFTSFRI